MPPLRSNPRRNGMRNTTRQAPYMSPNNNSRDCVEIFDAPACAYSANLFSGAHLPVSPPTTDESTASSATTSPEQQHAQLPKQPPATQSRNRHGQQYATLIWTNYKRAHTIPIDELCDSPYSEMYKIFASRHKYYEKEKAKGEEGHYVGNNVRSNTVPYLTRNREEAVRLREALPVRPKDKAGQDWRKRLTKEFRIWGNRKSAWVYRINQKERETRLTAENAWLTSEKKRLERQNARLKEQLLHARLTEFRPGDDLEDIDEAVTVSPQTLLGSPEMDPGNELSEVWPTSPSRSSSPILDLADEDESNIEEDNALLQEIDMADRRMEQLSFDEAMISVEAPYYRNE